MMEHQAGDADAGPVNLGLCSPSCYSSRPVAWPVELRSRHRHQDQRHRRPDPVAGRRGFRAVRGGDADRRPPAGTGPGRPARCHAAHRRPLRAGRVRPHDRDHRPVHGRRPVPGRGQTAYIVTWITLNTVGIIRHWDTYPFILLNLTFSTQAAYGALLILLAQNRQDERDRASSERDREVAARTKADTEYLARELATIRLALTDAITTRDLNDAVAQIEKLIIG
jgi:hypothetical protein